MALSHATVYVRLLTISLPENDGLPRALEASLPSEPIRIEIFP
jgi:hypothetical protein